MSNFRWLGGLALLSMFAASTASAAGSNPLADAVRAANDRFKDVATAVAEGYTPIPCDSSPAGGGMGIHYVNAAYLKDAKLDIARPQAVMYEPMPDGTLVLIAAEYIAFKGPASLEGHLMNYNSAPNSYGLPEFYELHVWAWKANPQGTFADDNPDVSCDAVKLESK
jgi:hypothetical protein